MNCLKCDCIHDGKFGSGKYCSRKCANSRIRTQELKDRVSKKQIGKRMLPREERVCLNCDTTFVVKCTAAKKYCSSKCFNSSPASIRIKDTKKHRDNLSKAIKNHYKEGKQVSGGRTKWFDYKNIRVQGTYELRTCKILDFWKEQNIILDWEYTNDRFTYSTKEGAESTYLLDFKVFTTDGNFYYLEIKGYIRENDLLKWEAVKELGHNIVIWFLNDIIKEEKTIRI